MTTLSEGKRSAVAGLVPDPADQPTMTVEEVAVVFDLGRSSAYEAVGRGDIPAIRIGKRWIVPTAAVRRLLSLDREPETVP